MLYDDFASIEIVKLLGTKCDLAYPTTILEHAIVHTEALLE